MVDKQELNELVVRLMKEQKVEASRPKKTAEDLKKCIDRDYVHIMFPTGTELSFQLYRPDCNFSKADFDESKGSVHLEGGLTLNYNKVRCVADINLENCEGNGFLKPVSDEEYRVIMGKNDFDE